MTPLVEPCLTLRPLAHQDLEGLPGDVKQAMQAEVKQEKITFEDIKDYILENRYKVVGFTWAGVVGSVLVSTWANKNVS